MGTMIEVMGAQAARARASMQVSRLSSMSTKVDESTPGTPTAQPSAPLSPAVPAVAAPPISHKKGASSSSSATNSRPAQTQRAPSTGGTYGLPWTEEEKRHFKELLLIYPDEDVIIQRCAKISRALGTRTPQQVCSRMQKYFIELAKNHKPIPGRLNSDYKVLATFRMILFTLAARVELWQGHALALVILVPPKVLEHNAICRRGNVRN